MLYTKGSKMSKRKRNRGLSTANEPCQEPVASYKARVKTAKRQLKAIMELHREGAIEYDIQNEVVGRAYTRVVDSKRELEYRRRNA